MRIVFALFILFWTLAAQARVLVVSDIDDTLKISQVKSVFARIPLAFQNQNAFRGMPELFQLIRTSNLDAGFVYLSNAPAWFLKFRHAHFLKMHEFPRGGLILREDLPVETHKLVHLRTLLRQSAASEVILIGDNGERDPEIYEQIRKEFPDLKIHIFIRTLYSQSQGYDLVPLSESVQTFVRPSEVAAKLLQAGLLDDSKAKDFILKIESRANYEGAQDRSGPAFQRSWMSGEERRVQDQVDVWSQMRDWERKRLAPSCRRIWF